MMISSPRDYHCLQGGEMVKRCGLVTGGAGFIGSHLVEALLDDGWSVKVLDPQCTKSPNLKNVAGCIQLIEGDFADRDIARVALDGVDTLFHYASTTSPATAHSHPVFDVTTNTVGTLKLLEEAVSRGITRLIFPSSGGTVYGPAIETPVPESHPTNPICSHGIVKLANEKYIELFHREHGLNYTILRYSNPYGPRQRPDGSQGAVGVFAGKILSQQRIEIWGDGTTVRDFIYIDDLVHATLSAVHSERATNSVINIGSGTGVSIKELVTLIEEATGIGAIVRYGPARSFDVPASTLAIDQARALLGWWPTTPLREGLEITIPWIKDYLVSRIERRRDRPAADRISHTVAS